MTGPQRLQLEKILTEISIVGSAVVLVLVALLVFKNDSRDGGGSSGSLPEWARHASLTCTTQSPKADAFPVVYRAGAFCYRR